MKWLTDLLETQGGQLLMLLMALLAFSGVTVAVLVFMPANQIAFQLFANLVTGFGASLMTATQIKKNPPSS